MHGSVSKGSGTDALGGRDLGQGLPQGRALGSSRRDSSESKDFERPQTSASSTYSLSGSVGSVRKRLSLLKMPGRKHSKTSVKVDVVLEE